MQTSKLLLVISLAVLVGCANKQTKDDAPAAAPQKQGKAEKAKKDKVAGSAVAIAPAPGSKFAKLKLGMTMKQVVVKIGAPADQWQRPTGKAAIPFYFGDDRWVVETSYKKEGRLTFTYGGDQVLTDIAVNTAE